VHKYKYYRVNKGVKYRVRRVSLKKIQLEVFLVGKRKISFCGLAFLVSDFSLGTYIIFL